MSSCSHEIDRSGLAVRDNQSTERSIGSSLVPWRFGSGCPDGFESPIDDRSDQTPPGPPLRVDVFPVLWSVVLSLQGWECAVIKRGNLFSVPPEHPRRQKGAERRTPRLRKYRRVRARNAGRLIFASTPAAAPFLCKQLSEISTGIARAGRFENFSKRFVGALASLRWCVA